MCTSFPSINISVKNGFRSVIGTDKVEENLQNAMG